MWSAAARRDRKLSRVHCETLGHAPLDETFAFFADASNLERLTPAWLRFSIRTRMPVVMRTGLEIEYRIRPHGLPVAWRSRIDEWETSPASSLIRGILRQ
jgi:ligand-binding SRPBCC domain-containing protein